MKKNIQFATIVALILSFMICSVALGEAATEKNELSTRINIDISINTLSKDGIFMAGVAPEATIQDATDAGLPIEKEPFITMDNDNEKLISDIYLLDMKNVRAKMDDIRFSGGELQFMDGKLMSISLSLADELDAIDALKAAEELYGEPTKAIREENDTTITQNVWDIDWEGKHIQLAHLVQRSGEDLMHASFQLGYVYMLETAKATPAQ